jgi:mono/diheme cytochrome c family protein
MVRNLGWTLLASLALSVTSASAQSQGETLFQRTCIACHTINGGRLVGPDLANIQNRRDEAWIIRFIQSSSSVIAGGDPEAVKLFEEFNSMVMPDHPLSDDEALAIITFIASKSLSEEIAVPTPASSEEADPVAGQDLFVGLQRFANGGPACNSCHNVATNEVMTGGGLAIDLTQTVSRLSQPGVEAMMSNPPYPAMLAAFGDHPLTQKEVSDVSAFLKSANESQGEAPNYANVLLMWGMIGLVLLLGFFAMIGSRSSKVSVNQSIYQRQIESS